jgi:hypothetical protein
MVACDGSFDPEHRQGDSGDGDWGSDTDSEDSWGDDRAARSGPRTTARPDVRQGDRGEHVRYVVGRQDLLEVVEAARLVEETRRP